VKIATCATGISATANDVVINCATGISATGISATANDELPVTG
jgi:hypothetical protein